MPNLNPDNAFDGPTPPEPFVIDVADPDEAWPHFKRRLTILERLDKLEASIIELKEQIAEARSYRVIGGRSEHMRFKGGAWAGDNEPKPYLGEDE